MEIRMNAEQCTGCGACVEICPTGAIRLIDGLAIFNQARCTQCRACADACPVGAITAVELPVIASKSVTPRPVREPEIVVAEPISSTTKPWLISALVFAGREILPQLTEALIISLDRRLAQAKPAKPQASLPYRNAELSPTRKSGQSYRRQSRFSHGRRHRRGRDHSAGKGCCF